MRLSVCVRGRPGSVVPVSTLQMQITKMATSQSRSPAALQVHCVVNLRRDEAYKMRRKACAFEL